MEQKDYLKKEIEKIGMITSAIRQKLFGDKANLAISFEKQMEETKGLLLEETNFDLDYFLKLNVENSNKYILTYKGFSVENIENLADCIYQTTMNYQAINSKRQLEKSLQLYQLCNFKSNTYSLKREAKIQEVKSALSSM